MKGFKTYRFIVIAMLVFSAGDSIAQQDWQYSQYMFNLYDVNGAYAGNYPAFMAGMRIRRQWTGFEGAPASNYLSLHGPVAKQKLGLGLRVLDESIGSRGRLHAAVTGAYKLKLANGKLSFGINAGVIQERYDREKLNPKDEDDETLTNMNQQSVVPVFDFSVMYTTAEFFTGLEVKGLNEPKFDVSPASTSVYERHYVLVAGLSKDLGSQWIIRPSILVRALENGVVQPEVNAALLWKRMIWFGAGYRHDHMAMFYTQLLITPSFRIGYNYDLTISGMAPQQSGSHEIFVGYRKLIGGKNQNSIRHF